MILLLDFLQSVLERLEMFDLIIRGDQVVTPQGTGAWDICILGETIAAIAAPGNFDDSQASLEEIKKMQREKAVVENQKCLHSL